MAQERKAQACYKERDDPAAQSSDEVRSGDAGKDNRPQHPERLSGVV
jgi:hypothetical protein